MRLKDYINEQAIIIKKLTDCIKEKDNLNSIASIQANDSFEKLSIIYSDHLALQFDLTEKYLKEKKYPAIKSAEEIKELKSSAIKFSRLAKKLEYKLDARNYFT